MTRPAAQRPSSARTVSISPLSAARYQPQTVADYHQHGVPEVNSATVPAGNDKDEITPDSPVHRIKHYCRA